MPSRAADLRAAAERRAREGRMRRIALASAIAAVSVVALVALVAWRALGANDPPGADALHQRETELRRLKAQIEEKRRATEKLRSEGKDVEQVLQELERQRGMTERYLGELATQEAQIEAEIVQRQQDLVVREQAHQATRSGLAQALVRYYKERQVSAAELLLSSKTFSEVFARSQYWVRAIRNIRQQLAEADRQRQEVAQQIAGIDERRRAVESIKQERQQQLAALDREREQQQQHSAEVQQQIDAFEEQARKLTASQKEIERLIAEAQRDVSGGAGLEAQRGRLPWPVSGTVVTTFGTQIHPRYGTQVEQKGIEIAADEGAPVCAIAAGRVVFEGWLEGYGKTVILDHGGGYFTLYAHASETLVTRGVTVAAGDRLARVGNTESIVGSALYLEIRKGALALDPAIWLKTEGPR
jgi:murein hydrolase activator